jgi:hypothetical protein
MKLSNSFRSKIIWGRFRGSSGSFFEVSLESRSL